MLFSHFSGPSPLSTLIATANTQQAGPVAAVPVAIPAVQARVAAVSALARMPAATVAYVCTASYCSGLGNADAVFKLLQTLINQAFVALRNDPQLRFKLGGVTTTQLAVTGRIDAATANAFYRLSRVIGGPLLVIDATVDMTYVAAHAITIVQGLAGWLGVSVSLPSQTGPTPIVPAACPNGTVMTSRGCIPEVGTNPAPGPFGPDPTNTPPLTTPPDGTSTPPSPDTITTGLTPFPITQTPPVQLQPPTPAVTPTGPGSRYAVGCVARFNTTRGVYNIYCPPSVAAPAFGLGDASAVPTVTPPPPVGAIAPTGTETVTTFPINAAGVPQVGDEQNVVPLFKNPLFWVAVASGVVVVGGGSYLLFRHKGA